MTKPTIKSTVKLMALKQKKDWPAKIVLVPPKQKQNQLVNNTNKQVKKNQAMLNFNYVFSLFLRCRYFMH